jgi:hypothetical protein
VKPADAVTRVAARSDIVSRREPRCADLVFVDEPKKPVTLPCWRHAHARVRAFPSQPSKPAFSSQTLVLAMAAAIAIGKLT